MEFVRAIRPAVAGDLRLQEPERQAHGVADRAGHGRPRLAVKVATTDAAGLTIEAERRALLDLEASWPRLKGVPQVLGSVDFNGRPGIVMTAVPGTPMRTTYLRWRHTARRACVAADFAAVERWVSGFQQQTSQGSARLEMDAGVSARLAQRYGDAVRDDLERLDEIWARLRDQRVTATAVHGDLWAANVLVIDGHVSGVVDWEGAARSGQPARDIARFAHMYALFLDRRTRLGRRVPGHRALQAGDWGAAVAYAIEGTGWFPELFRQFLQRNLVRLGAPASSWRDLALAGVAEVAALADNDEYAQLHLDLFRRLAAPIPHHGYRGSPIV